MKKTDLKRLLDHVRDALDAVNEAEGALFFLPLDSKDKNIEMIETSIQNAGIDLDYAENLLEVRLEEEDAAEEDKAEAAA